MFIANGVNGVPMNLERTLWNLLCLWLTWLLTHDYIYRRQSIIIELMFAMTFIWIREGIKLIKGCLFLDPLNIRLRGAVVVNIRMQGNLGDNFFFSFFFFLIYYTAFIHFSFLEVTYLYQKTYLTIYLFQQSIRFKIMHVSDLI